MNSKRAVALASFAAAALILILRKSDSIQNPQLFAEDGTVFFVEARQLGIQAVLIPHGGYLHLVPRLVAQIGKMFDPLWIPAFYNTVALVLDLTVLAMLFSSRVKLPAKPALALAFALIPHSGEVFLSLTNIQWCLALVLVLILLANDATSVRQICFDLAAIVVCGLTGPFICFLSPLFVLRAALLRSRTGTMLMIVALTMAAIQGCCLYAGRNHFARSTPADPLQLTSAMGTRIFGTFWTGYGTAVALPSPIRMALAITLLAIGGWFAFRRGEWQVPRVYLGLAWLGFVVPVAAKFLHEPGVLGSPTNGDRYFFLPHVLISWLLVIACIQMKGWRSCVPAALLAASLVFNLPYLKSAPLHDYAWATHVQPIRDGDSFEIPINPEGLMLEGNAIPKRP
jgi:hypothetical protein